MTYSRMISCGVGMLRLEVIMFLYSLKEDAPVQLSVMYIICSALVLPQPKQTQITVAEKLSEFFFSSIHRQVISHLKPSLSKKSRQVLEESFKVKTHFTFDKPFIKTQFPYTNYVILTAIGCNTW